MCRQRDLFRQGFDRFLHGELIKPKIFGDIVTVRFYPLLDPPGRGNMAEKNEVQVSISVCALMCIFPSNRLHETHYVGQGKPTWR